MRLSHGWIFAAFNFVDKKLKKVIWGLFILQKYIYLCRMNYLLNQYHIYVASIVQFQTENKSVAAVATDVVCCQENNQAFSAHTEDITCLECRNL